MGGFLPFLGVSAVVITTPGQDTALTIRNTLLGGRPGGVYPAVGVTPGQAIWTLAPSAATGAVLAASEPALAAPKLGAAHTGLPRRAIAPRRYALARWPGAEFRRAGGCAIAAGQRAAPRPAQQPQQPEDAGLLRQPAAAVRKHVLTPPQQRAEGGQSLGGAKIAWMGLMPGAYWLRRASTQRSTSTGQALPKSWMWASAGGSGHWCGSPRSRPAQASPVLVQ